MLRDVTDDRCVGSYRTTLYTSVFEVWAFSFTSRRLCRLSCINEYLAIDSGGNVSDLVLARNYCLARMLPGEAELASE